MKTFAVKWILVTIMIVIGLAVAHAVAWADILFWKIGWVAGSLAVPEYVLLFPTIVIPIAPGSALDTPWFFFPACVINIAAWSLLFTWIWRRRNKKESANNTPICHPADGLPKPSA